MKVIFVVAKGKEVLGQSASREDAIGYLQETYGDELINSKTYQPKCQGLLEEFKCKKDSFRVIEVRSENDQLDDVMEKACQCKTIRVPKPVVKVRNEATTPTRTRLRINTGNKTPPVPASSLEEGTIKLGEDGNHWVNKRKGGKFKWVKYIPETHDGLERKRKAPNMKAKEFKAGTVKKGNDGNDWVVKEVKGGKFRWVRHN